MATPKKGPYVLAWDLGTGGNKASLYNAQGDCLAACFTPYDTTYPAPGWHEQRPWDWWHAVVESTRHLLRETQVNVNEIVGCGISGHSLGVVSLDRQGRLLLESTPIWSDARAAAQADRFFERVDERRWYRATGNGFPPPLYKVCCPSLCERQSNSSSWAICYPVGAAPDANQDIKLSPVTHRDRSDDI